MSDLRRRLKELDRKTKIVGLGAEDAGQLHEYLEDLDLKFRFFVGDLIRRNAKGAVEEFEWAHASMILVPGRIGGSHVTVGEE